MSKRLSILGATGSIGTSTLDVVREAEPGAFRIVSLTANCNWQDLAKLAHEFRPDCLAVADPACADPLKAAVSDLPTEVISGPRGLVDAAERDCDVTLAAIMGAAGLAPTLAAVAQGRTVALANKECLVCAGDLFMAEVAKHGTTLLPVDSEHNAIFQVFDDERRDSINRLILTASGGPFRGRARESLTRVSREDALAHPNWDMGAKISIDSATLMNKGLELIEAHYLFAMPPEQLDVVVHPQSIIHSMVEYRDGSTLAQMGLPDMRTPIAYALAWPQRMGSGVDRLDLAKIGALTFEAPDTLAFPALNIAKHAMAEGGHATNILNAANEIAVSAFLKSQLPFLAISEVSALALERLIDEFDTPTTLEDVVSLDHRARTVARTVVDTLSA